MDFADRKWMIDKLVRIQKEVKELHDCLKYTKE